MNWTEIDWTILERLRARFLGNPAADGPYWESAADLANYDFTYGERIGWKWDHVLRELRLRGWSPPPGMAVFDWGCGSGIASRRVVEFFGAPAFSSLTVWDHSPLACDYAADTAQRAFPGLPVTQATPGLLAADSSLGLVVVSHVLNELPPAAMATLRQVIARAQIILWVEPGTSAISRQLGALRDELVADFSVLAPCTHARPCPMFAAGHERDWCHFFAPPPAGIYADSNWVKFGQRAGIDLRSLPYCFLALDRTRPAAPPAELSRVIGRVEHFKPYARLLNCDTTGLSTLELPKRADPALFKELERTRAPLVYRWRREGDRILGGTAWTSDAAAPGA